MPCGRMQHTAALPCGNSCSAYATKSIESTLKKNFLQTNFRLQKLWNETSELRLIFFSNWVMPFWNPLLIICCAANLWWDRHFADRIFMPHGMQKPCLSCAALTHTLFSPFATWRGHIFFDSAMPYSVDAPIDLIEL